MTKTAVLDLDYWRRQASPGRNSDTNEPSVPSADDFQLLAENLPNLCWIARADGFIFWYNQRWHDYCGTTPEVVAGSGWHRVHDPITLPQVLEKWSKAIDVGEAFELNCPLRGRDGIYRRFLTRVVPVRDKADKIVRWIGTNTEIESQMRTEEALAGSESSFRVLTNAMPQMVWSTLPDGFHDYYNNQWYEFTGVPHGSTDGEGWNAMFHPDDRERAWARWRHSLDTGEPYEIEYRLRHNSGDYRWALGRALPVRDEHNAIIRWIGTCTDIDDAKRNTQQTELLSRELSHRIKNIFAVIAGLIGLSSYREPGNEEFGSQLAGRISALGRAHDFARPHSDISRPYADFMGLHGMLTELLIPYREQGSNRIVISGEDMRIDERSATPIALAVHELATNAVKYGALSNVDGTVEILTAVDGENVTIQWNEKGGPEITSIPIENGFGTQLSNISIEDQLGGKIERKWARTGLQVMLSIDASRLRA